MLVIQGGDPSVFLDGVRALLVTHRFLLSEPGREFIHERVNFHWCGVVPVRYAPLSVRLMHRFPLTSESIVPLQPRRVQSNMPPPFWLLWVVCQYIATLIVS